MGLKNTSFDQTDLMTFLVWDAKDSGDEDKLYKMIERARHRRRVDIGRLLESVGMSFGELQAKVRERRESKNPKPKTKRRRRVQNGENDGNRN